MSLFPYAGQQYILLRILIIDWKKKKSHSVRLHPVIVHSELSASSLYLFRPVNICTGVWAGPRLMQHIPGLGVLRNCMSFLCHLCCSCRGYIRGNQGSLKLWLQHCQHGFSKYSMTMRSHLHNTLVLYLHNTVLQCTRCTGRCTTTVCKFQFRNTVVCDTGKSSL